MHAIRTSPPPVALILATLLAWPTLASAVTPFKMRVPIGPQSAVAAGGSTVPVTLELAAAALPPAALTAPYSFDFKTLLSISGSNPPAPGEITWGVAGAVPAGLALGADGTLSGTPAAKAEAGSSFEVTAAFDTAQAPQTYILYVNGTVLLATQITAGQHHSCAVTTSGGVKCWGSNDRGQLGDGTIQQRLVPTQVPGLESGVASVQAGLLHTCALMTSGGVKCWGYNAFGQAGNGTFDNELHSPADVVDLANVVKLSTSDSGDFNCAVTAAGAARCWGRGQNGQLGNGGWLNRNVPVDVTGLGSGVTDIAAGGLHACAATAGGAKCWGYGGNGRLGNGLTSNTSNPVDVVGLGAGASRVAAGAAFSCAVVSAGTQCWGANSLGQLGDTTTTERWTPAAVSGLDAGEVTSIDSGNGHSCVTTASGVAKCWGEGGWSALGNGTTANRLTATAVNMTGVPVAAISAGRYHSCALTSGSATKCWGQGGNGRLGNNLTTTQLLPVDALP